MPNLKINIPKDIQDIHKLFKKNGKQLYIVGGAIRDAILGKSPKDYDLATNATPDEMLRIANRGGYKTLELGKSFGVIVIRTKQTPDGHEIATFRKDIGKGRRPDSVEYTDIKGDVERRDLTINALFYDMDSKQIVDLVGGIADLKKKQIRTVGVPTERFDEDPLRKLRALRFAGLLKGTLGKETYKALKDNPSLGGVSPERIRDEFIKGILKSKSTKAYFKMISDLGFWGQILPGVHVATDYIETNDYEIQLAWLLRKNSSTILKSKLNYLKYSIEESRNILFLLMLSEFNPDDIFLIKKAQENVNLSDRQVSNWGKLIGSASNIQRILKFKLSINGEDLLKMGLKGKQIGDKMKELETKKFLGLNESMMSLKSYMLFGGTYVV